MANYKMTEYQGGWNSLDPNKAYSNSFTGYRANISSLGTTTDPRTANIMKDASAKLSSGIKNIELTLVTPELFDSVPKQQLSEIHELAGLTGAEVSVHGPVMDSAGFNQQGFSETNRQAAERKIADFVLRSQQINPNGNVPIVFHSAEGIIGSDWKTLGDDKTQEKRTATRLIAVNRESGQMNPMEQEIKFYPDRREYKEKVIEDLQSGRITEEQFKKMTPQQKYEYTSLEKGKTYSPERNLRITNTSEWDNKLSALIFNKERADEILQNNSLQIAALNKKIQEPGSGLSRENMSETQQKVKDHYDNARAYLEDTGLQLNALFSKAYKYGNPEQKKDLEKLGDKYSKILEETGDTPEGQSKAMQFLISNLKTPKFAPQIYVPIEEFATEQSSKTFGNAAFKAYKKYGDKAPIIAIENPPAGFGLSTGEDLRNLVKSSREKFVENLVKEQGMNKKQAEKTAEKFIGATWDVGHINMLRKQGFSEEDIIKESEKIAPYLKHVHLSDNFGFEHTELPMGMGNVPFKEIMEKLGEKGFEAKKVIEAGTWWQHFQTNPFKESLEGLGSPMFSDYLAGGPAKVGGMPYWNQSLGFQQSYGEGFGRMLPGINYQTFGAGFSQLPSHLGGDAGGGGQGGRMSGTPME